MTRREDQERAAARARRAMNEALDRFGQACARFQQRRRKTVPDTIQTDAPPPYWLRENKDD